MSTGSRPLYYGHDVYSPGRGGVGNIRSPSPSRDPVVTIGLEDFFDTRGREPIPAESPNVTISTGRGGEGNIRSPSRDAVRGYNASTEASPLRSEQRGHGHDRELITVMDSVYGPYVPSSGRGGADNMIENPYPRPGSFSRSREPSHTSGRGGLGSIYHGGPTEKAIEELDESERASSQYPTGLYSVGRGGTGNVTPGQLPHLEDAVRPHDDSNHPHASHMHGTVSTGRGGLGNILYENASRDMHHHGHGLSNLLHGIVRD